NTTISTTPGEQKNSTGNIFSLLIYTGGISVELTINPAESNTQSVVLDHNYQFDNPTNAAQPANALWAPSYAGTALDTGAGRPAMTSNNSYAHVLPFGKRKSRWQGAFTATEAVVGDRGPAYATSDAATYPANGRWTLVTG